MSDQFLRSFFFEIFNITSDYGILDKNLELDLKKLFKIFFTSIQ
jgi:hypothetical protein